MASIRVDGHEVPLVFPLDEHGRATVSTHLLHVRFKFVESSIYVEEEKHSESGEIQQSIPVEPYIPYFGRLEASQNNIVHFNMKKSISVDGILVEYVGSSCSSNVISIKMRVPLIHYSEM